MTDLGSADAPAEEGDGIAVGVPPTGKRLARAGWPFGVVAAVLLANLPAIVGLVDTDPLGSLGGTASSVRAGFLPGWFTADREAGWVSQALGHLVAQDWLHGIVPWWNPYEGLGMPLAAEMQAGAFFPPTLLLALPHGQLVLHVVVEVTAGLGAWLLARELGCSRPAATLGGVLFALNGTFALMGTATPLVVPFLPFTILGVERIWRRAGDYSGFVILALSLAMSFYAGFVETAYVELLFALLWFVVRMFGSPASGRLRFALTTGGGALAGGLMCAPLLIAFAEYLPDALVGAHNGQFAGAHVPAIAVPTIAVPWLFGPIRAFHPPGVGDLLNEAWGNIGGFLTATAVCAAAFGLVSRRADRSVRVLLGAVTVLTLAFTFGFKPLQEAVDHLVPLADNVWFARYAPPAWEFSVAMLACYGADWVLGGRDQQATGRLEKWAFPAGALITLLVTAAGLVFAEPALRQLFDEAPGSKRYAIVALVWCVGTLAGLVGCVALARRRSAAQGTAAGPRRSAAYGALGVVALDAVAAFVYPQLSAPRSVVVDAGPAQYLAAHLGDGRYFSLDVYLPNYGSYFQIASLDSNDSPVPKVWDDYVTGRLAPNSEAYYFGTHPRSLTGPNDVQQLAAHLSAYEAAGVRYVVLGSGTQLPPGGLGPGVAVAYQDSLATIYALPQAAPFFSAGPTCSVRPDGATHVAARCTTGSTLVRAELEVPGWVATVDGRPVPVSAVDGGLESVPLPAGTSDVRFSYTPPRTTLAVVLFLVGVAGLVGAPFALRLTRRRER